MAEESRKKKFSSSGQASKEKELVLKLFLFCSKLLIIDMLLKILRQNIKIKLNYVVGWQSRSFLTGLLQYLAKICLF